MMPQGCLPLGLFLILLVLLPLFLAEVMLAALGRLGLSPEVSIFAAFGIFLGSMINIPVQKIPRAHMIESDPMAFFGMNRFFKKTPSRQDFTLIAVNVGGCVVPCMIVAYQVVRILSHGPNAAFVAFGAIALNIYLCYQLAQPVPKVGIALPALVPALAAAICAYVFMPDFAPPIAFCAGVLGPLVGADLLHLQDIQELDTSVASIGGAGTFDGIVLSGLLATLLV